MKFEDIFKDLKYGQRFKLIELPEYGIFTKIKPFVGSNGEPYALVYERSSDNLITFKSASWCYSCPIELVED